MYLLPLFTFTIREEIDVSSLWAIRDSLLHIRPWLMNWEENWVHFLIEDDPLILVLDNAYCTLEPLLPSYSLTLIYPPYHPWRPSVSVAIQMIRDILFTLPPLSTFSLMPLHLSATVLKKLFFMCFFFTLAIERYLAAHPFTGVLYLVGYQDHLVFLIYCFSSLRRFHCTHSSYFSNVLARCELRLLSFLFTVWSDDINCDMFVSRLLDSV